MIKSNIGLRRAVLQAVGIKQSELKALLRNKSGCEMQHTGWTCGTCFFSISKDLDNKEWQTVLFVRGDYDLFEEVTDRKQYFLDDISKDPSELAETLKKVIKIYETVKMVG